MAKLKFQVLHEELRKPVIVRIFDSDPKSYSGHAGRKAADELRKRLDDLKIKFSAVDCEPPIKISVAKKDLLRVRKAGIDKTSPLKERQGPTADMRLPAPLEWASNISTPETSSRGFCF